MKIKALYLKTVLELGSKINPDIYIYQDKDTVVTQSIQEGNTCLLECNIKTNINKSEDVLYFSLNKITNIIRSAKDEDIIEIILEGQYIIFKINDLRRKTRIFVPDKKRFTLPDERKENPFNFSHEFDFFLDDFIKPLIASSDIKSGLNIKYKDKKLIFLKDDKIDNFEAPIKNMMCIKGEKELDNLYNSDFIYQLVSKMKDKINIKISQDAPIKISNELYTNFTIKYMVAPLVRVEE